MVWEHKHIANAKLAAKSSGEAVTLRQLLQLDKVKDVPETWPSANYDYFWIVDYAGGSTTPTGFRMVKQVFDGRYAKLLSNDWGTPNGLTSDSECDLKALSEGLPQTRLRPISSAPRAPSSGETGVSRWRPLPSGLSARNRSWNTTRLER